MSLHQPIPARSFRADTTLAAASKAAGGDRTRTTLRLLEALLEHERDSDLGSHIASILQAGDFYAKATRAEYEDAALACDDVIYTADNLANGWRQSAEYMAEGMQ